MKAFDLHCDTLMKLSKSGDLNRSKGSVTLNGLQQGHVAIQCFADFVPTGMFPNFCRDALSRFMFNNLYQKYEAMMKHHADILHPVLSEADIDQAEKQGKIGVILTIEDGGVLGEQISNVEKYYNKGVRLITLTWNHPNPIGAPNSSDPNVMSQGLTPYGRDVVREMDRLGIVVDVSHVSDGVFWDVVKTTQNPFVASHSNARALCGHTRNLSDEMIRALTDKGGVMGLNLGPEFLSEQGQVSRIEDMVQQVLHIRNVGGSDVLALGSDFDGIHGEFEVAGPQDWPKLHDALHKAGLSEAELDKMWWKNAVRVFRTVLK